MPEIKRSFGYHGIILEFILIESELNLFHLQRDLFVTTVAPITCVPKLMNSVLLVNLRARYPKHPGPPPKVQYFDPQETYLK